MNTLLKTLTISLLLLTACSDKPKTELIQLTYKLKNNQLHYRRLGAILWDTPEIEISCTLTNTSIYNGIFRIDINVISENAEKKNIYIERYIKAGNTIDIQHKEKIKKNTFKKLYIENFNIKPECIEINIITKEKIR
jgi:hypothetical protein